MSLTDEQIARLQQSGIIKDKDPDIVIKPLVYKSTRGMLEFNNTTLSLAKRIGTENNEITKLINRGRI